ncbi:hypothetical protein, partial [Klebsiella pneumoniae]|uniref:hypothetical protein n=1 Tax=Klebsiella pneumoniae TaxID=573 RepID=UPI000B664F0E
VGHLFMFLVGGKTPDQSVHLNLTTTELMVDSSIYPATIIGNLVVRRWENRHAPRTLYREGLRRSGAG